MDVTLRRGLLLVAAASALTAVLAGLARLGVPVAFGPSHAGAHGPLFVLGVFGTVIGLERAVALARGVGFLAPALGAAAAVAMLAGLPFAPWLAVASSAALAGVNGAIVRRHSAAFTWLMLAGSGALVGGSVAWALGRPVFEVVPAWLAFFVLTIVAERLELSRLAPTPRWASRALVVLAAAFVLLACGRPYAGDVALRALGVTMALLGAWQLRFDLARRTVRQPRLPRYSAIGVMAGAPWLVVAGALFAGLAPPPTGPVYDAALHAVFVGYVLSMVFAHAPIILPAVARLPLPFHPVLYVPLAALHASLVVRLSGDLLGHAALRQAGAIGNAASLAGFALAVVTARLLRREA